MGCATGRLEWRGEQATATAAQEGLYWRYERRVRELESRAGLLTAVTGALLAVRRSSFRPVPATASMDHLLPLYVREAGGGVVYVPQRHRDGSADQRPARAVPQPEPDRLTGDPGEPVDGRAARPVAPTAGRRSRSGPTRSCAGRRHGSCSSRSSAGLVEAARGSAPAAVIVGLIAVGAVAAGLGQLLASSGRRPPRLLAFARAFAIVNVAFAVGWINVLRGRSLQAWSGLEWERPG